MPPVVKKVSTVSPTTAPVVAEKKALKTKVVAKKDEPVVEPVVAVVESEEKCASDIIITDLFDKIVALSTHIKTIQMSMKSLVKEFDKQKKIIDKVQKKREKAKKSPSGFAKPCKISNDLCDFIGVEHGAEMSRTDITRHINSYVKEKNLNNPENRREFFPDQKLKTILNITDGEKVTYFILQRLIAHHFPPSLAKQAAAAKAA